MFTKLESIESLKRIWSELFFNKTNKVTKIADNSVLNGTAYGNAKIGQKALKDIALVESQLFPESAVEGELDAVAQRAGVASRFSSSNSSAYLRIVADPGTVYLQGVQIFKSSAGINFISANNITISALGWGYYLVNAQELGLKTNVEALQINSVSPQPVGHKYVINEFTASGGRDDEDDDLFRKRIVEGPNILARGTAAYLTQAAIKSNPNILKVVYLGFGSNGKNILTIFTQNGIDLTNNELDALAQSLSTYVSITDLKPYQENYIGIECQNPTWYGIDTSFRVSLDPAYNPDDIRKEIQILFNKEIDYRYYSGQKIEWDNLLQQVKTVPGVLYVMDQYFTPSLDIVVPKNQFPRMRGFLMLDLEGNMIVNYAGTLNPVYYPNEPDFSFQQSVLANI